MESSNNVIVFPIKNPRQTKTAEEVDNTVEMMKHYHIQETISNLAPMIFNQLDIAGFITSVDSSEDLKDGAFVVEALRSFMCKYYGIYHPFQQISDNVFHPDEDEAGALRITDKLNLELKKSETN